MPYTANTWTNGSSPLSAARMGNLETQYAEATLSLEQDLFTAFVYFGGVCTKDGSVSTQLDVTTGVAFLLQSDGTLRRRAWSNFTEVTATPSTTYFLDINPDGTFSWGTSHSAVANHLTIASVTTDGAHNILAVTDARQTATTFLGGMVGLVNLPTLGATSVAGQLTANDGIQAHAFTGGTDDAINVYDRNGVEGISLGWTQGGGGLYAYDHVNANFIFQNGKSTGITFNGNVSGAALFDAGSRVAVEGAHSNAGQPFLSVGNGAPGSLAANEVYFQLS